MCNTNHQQVEALITNLARTENTKKNKVTKHKEKHSSTELGVFFPTETYSIKDFHIKFTQR